MNKVLRVFQPSGNPWLDWVLLWSCMGVLVLIASSIRFTIVESLLAGFSSNIANSSTEAPHLLIVAGLVPVIEEIIFRSWLINSPALLVIGGGSCFATLVAFLLHGSAVLNTALGTWLVPLWVLGFAAIFTGLNTPVRPTKLLLLVGTVVTVLFGIIHITNYENLVVPNWLVFLVVLPQLAGGLFFLIGRIRVGLVGSIGLHAALNGEISLIGALPTMELIFIGALVSLVIKLCLIYRLRRWF
jgi:hypothetical protein